MRVLPFACLALAALSCAAGCGGSMYQASSGTRFDADDPREIDDEDVAKAFAARPQLPATMKVAYFSFDDAKADDVDAMLRDLPGVVSTYRVPALLVTGQRRYDEVSPWAPPQPLGVKKLRLIAARAHADVLVVFDHGWRGGGANGWAALDVLLVPVLFTPWLSNETESYAQAYVVDVRNGYVYGEASAETKAGKQAVTIYAKQPKDMADTEWPGLMSSLKAQLAAKLDAARHG